MSELYIYQNARCNDKEKSSLTCSHKPTGCPYPKPDKLFPRPHILFFKINFNIILSLGIGLQVSFIQPPPRRHYIRFSLYSFLK